MKNHTTSLKQGLTFLRIVLSLLLLSNFLICPVSSTKTENQNDILETKKECDLVLMRSFKLEGMKHPHEAINESICPVVVENCCTVVDELAILKFWEEFTMEKWKKFSAYVMYLIGNIINFQPYIQRMGMHNVPMFFTRDSGFKYFSYNCSLIESSKSTYKVNLIRTKLPKKLRNLKDRMLLDVFDGDKQKLKAYKKHEKLIEKQNLKFMKKNKNHPNLRNKALSPIIIDGMSEVQRDDFMKKMTAEEKTAFIQQHSIKVQSDEAVTKGRYRFLRDVRVMTKAMERKLRKVSQTLKNKLIQASDNYDEFLFKTDTDFKPILDRYQKSVEDFIESGKYYFEQYPKFIRYDYKSLRIYLQHIKTHMMENLEAAYNIMEAGGHIDKDFMVELLAKIKKNHYPDMLVPAVPIFTLPEVVIEPIVLSKIECTSRFVPQSRRLLVINTPKFEYCTNALNHVMKIKMEDYIQYLSNIKVDLLRMIGVKRGLYCVICDADMQKNIDYKNNVIYIDQDFCGNYISDFKIYFQFLNVVFIKYLDAIFQFMGCIQTHGDELNFPFFTIIEKKKRMARLWERCFEALGTAEEFKRCYFICSEFRYDKNSPMLEGDLDFLKTVYFEIMAFMRQNRMHMVKTVGVIGRKIDWDFQNSVMLKENDAFHHVKDKVRIAAYNPKTSLHIMRQGGYYTDEDHVQDPPFGRLLEEDNQGEERVLSQEELFDPGRLVRLAKTEDEFQQLMMDDKNIHQNHDIFFKPTKITLKKTTTINDVTSGESIDSRNLEETVYRSPPPRELAVSKKFIVQGEDPYIQVVKDETNLQKMKDKFHAEQTLKKQKEEGATEIDRDIKKNEIYERIDMTVDISILDQLFLHSGDGINPMKLSENANFDINTKKMMKQNLKSVKLEILDTEVIRPVVQLTNKKIARFNEDIDLQIKNSKNQRHVFKKVLEPEAEIEMDKDFYKIEESKTRDRLNGTETLVEKEDDTFKPFENLKLDVSKPDDMTEDEEIRKKLEKNPRMNSVYDVTRHFKD